MVNYEGFFCGSNLRHGAPSGGFRAFHHWFDAVPFGLLLSALVVLKYSNNADF